MQPAAAAAAGRRRAEELMADTCQIFVLGDPVLDPVTGDNTRPETLTYAGKCRARPVLSTGDGRSVDVGRASETLLKHLVSIPHIADDVAANQHVRITASADPSLIGLELVVRGIARGTHITARRLVCEEVSP